MYEEEEASSHLLWGAINSRDILYLKYLLERGADINARYNGMTCLMKGSFNLEICQLALSYGADVNAQDYAGRTALHHALDLLDLDVITFLLSKGADNSLKDSHGWDAFQKACECHPSNVQLVNIFVNSSYVSHERLALGYEIMGFKCFFNGDQQSATDLFLKALAIREENKLPKNANESCDEFDGIVEFCNSAEYSGIPDRDLKVHVMLLAFRVLRFDLCYLLDVFEEFVQLCNINHEQMRSVKLYSFIFEKYGKDFSQFKAVLLSNMSAAVSSVPSEAKESAIQHLITTLPIFTSADPEEVSCVFQVCVTNLEYASVNQQKECKQFLKKIFCANSECVISQALQILIERYFFHVSDDQILSTNDLKALEIFLEIFRCSRNDRLIPAEVFILACRKDFYYKEVVQLLLNYGADPDEIDERGRHGLFELREHDGKNDFSNLFVRPLFCITANYTKTFINRSVYMENLPTRIFEAVERH